MRPKFASSTRTPPRQGSRPALLPPRRGERGILLLECLTYLAIWVIVVGLAFTAFYRYLDYSKRLQRTSDDIVRTLRAGETWREDIRQAIGPPRLVTQGTREQALHIPRKSGEVVYLFLDGAISRRSAPDAPWTPVLGGVLRSEMRSEPRRHVRSWRWELELEPRRKSPPVKPLFSFEAVPPSRS